VLTEDGARSVKESPTGGLAEAEAMPQRAIEYRERSELRDYLRSWVGCHASKGRESGWRSIVEGQIDQRSIVRAAGFLRPAGDAALGVDVSLWTSCGTRCSVSYFRAAARVQDQPSGLLPF